MASADPCASLLPPIDLLLPPGGQCPAQCPGQGQGDVLTSFSKEVASALQPLVLPEVTPASLVDADRQSGDGVTGSVAAPTAKQPIFASPQRAAPAGLPLPTQYHHVTHHHHVHHHHHHPRRPSEDGPLVPPEDKQLCMLCPKRFDMDTERDLFLAHLVMDHNVVIADVKHVPYFPGYVEEWRKMFKHLSLDICPRIKTNYVACRRSEAAPVEEDEEEEEDAAASRPAGASSSDRTASSSGGGASPDFASDPDLKDDAGGGGGAALITDSGAVAVDIAVVADEADKEDSPTPVEAAVSCQAPPPLPPPLMQTQPPMMQTSQTSKCPEAGDAPALDVLKPRPAPEVEDPAIAAAHPALPPVYVRMEDIQKPNSPAKPLRSSASSDSMLSSSTSSSFLSTSASAAHEAATHGEDYHYLLCDAIPQDYALRQKLQRKRLEYALQRQEAERKDTSFSRQCLFCNAYFEGNRASLFHHMAEDHNFNVGQPDNIVFSNEFLDTLQSKLDHSICLYCEKDFRDKATLKDHMRKKMHRRIRGSNREYDKFYLINYLELGKSWNDIQSEEDIEIRPGPAAESEWADWTGEGTYSVCLFCSFPSPNTEEIYAHMRVVHGFDLSKIRASLKLSFYQQIKLINFYRRKLHEAACPACSLAFPDKESTVRHMQDSGHIADVPALVQWDQPQFFFPTYENDHLLSLLEDVDDNPEVSVVQAEEPADSSIYNSILSRKDLRQEILFDCGPGGYKGRGWK